MIKKIIILVILVLLLAGGGFYAYQHFTGPEYVVGKALEANNINDVKAYIKENSTDVDKTDQAKRMVKDKAKEIYQNYANDKAKSYDDCEKNLKELAGVEGCKEYTGLLNAYDKTTVTLMLEDEKTLVLERSNIALIRLALDF